MSIKYIFKPTQYYSIMAIYSIEEKEKREIKLLEEGRTFKEIAKVEHVSFSFISMVNKKKQGKTLQSTKNYQYQLKLESYSRKENH